MNIKEFSSKRSPKHNMFSDLKEKYKLKSVSGMRALPTQMNYSVTAVELNKIQNSPSDKNGKIKYKSLLDSKSTVTKETPKSVTLLNSRIRGKKKKRRFSLKSNQENGRNIVEQQ